MDYIYVLNECPCVWDEITAKWELYSPWGEILVFVNRKDAERVRSVEIRNYLLANHG